MSPYFLAYTLGIAASGGLIGGALWHDRLRRKLRRTESALLTEREARIRLECRLEAAHLAHFEDVTRLETELVWAQADAIVAQAFGREAA
jgi:hypothetical protein